MNENEAENSPFLKYKAEELKKEEENQRIINESYEDLQNNPKYKEFFEQYNSDSVKEFMKHYALEKGSWTKHGKLFLQMELKFTNQFRTHAYEGLWEIQQKKLFNLQCLWRAEQIELIGEF